jgi:4'-phosphopantetheinyl transferase
VVEVVGLKLDVAAARRARWLSWLSAAERARVARYVDPRHGERYLAAHAQLRWLLGERLGLPPEAVALERAPQGKPYLPGRPLRFNLSHCREFALVALHPAREVGVDLEWTAAPRDWLALARRFFTVAEAAWLAALPAGEQPRAFCRLWTCKEAWMKADGRGMAAGLRAIEVIPGDGSTPVVRGGSAWCWREIEAPPGFAATVVWAREDDAAVRVCWPAPPA